MRIATEIQVGHSLENVLAVAEVSRRQPEYVPDRTGSVCSATMQYTESGCKQTNTSWSEHLNSTGSPLSSEYHRVPGTGQEARIALRQVQGNCDGAVVGVGPLWTVAVRLDARRSVREVTMPTKE